MLAFWVVLYYCMQLQGEFMYFVMIGWLVAITCNSLGIIIGCVVSDMSAVMQLSSLLFVPQMLFGGYYIPTEEIPLVLRWANYLCGLKYAMNLGLYNEFRPSISSCQSSDLAASHCAGILTYNSIHSSDLWIYVLSLLLLLIGCRIIGGLILYEKAKRYY